MREEVEEEEHAEEKRREKKQRKKKNIEKEKSNKQTNTRAQNESTVSTYEIKVRNKQQGTCMTPTKMFANPMKIKEKTKATNR